MSLRPTFSCWTRVQPAAVALVVVVVALLSGCRDAVSPPTPRTRFAGRANRNSTSVERAPIVEGRVIVRLRPGASTEEVAADHGATRERDLPLERAALLEVSPGSEEATAAELTSDPRVEFAELDYLMALAPCDVGACQTTNDPFLAYRWDLNNTGEIVVGSTRLAVTGKVDADVDWLEMADALGSSPQGEAIVGIIDSGIRAAHQDLTGRVVAARNFATGYPADLTDDRVGHGTHVAGIVAARGNNGAGATGIAYGPNIKLVNAKACELYLFPDNTVQSSCPTSSVADAIVWAVDQGAKIINLSIGGRGDETAGSELQRAALQYAREHGALPICAAGNENYPNVSFPARFPECVAIGATNWSDQKASYSNFSPKVALSAPGGDGEAAPYSFILSTYPDANNNLYAFVAGTSQAAPQVAGLAALLYGIGVTSPDDILARLQQTADDLGPAGPDPQFGAGRINAYRALTLKDPGAPPIAHIDPIAPGVEGSPTSFASTGSGDPNGHAISYRWDFGDGTTSTDANPTHTYVDDGEYQVTLTVTDESNRATTATSSVNIANQPPVLSVSLSASRIASGESVALHGTFTDAGVADGPWRWSIAWGHDTKTTGSAESQSTAIDESHRFCSAHLYVVRMSMRDTDGGVDHATNLVTVVPNDVRIGAVRDLDDMLEGHGNVPVVVFSTPTFDARTIDPGTATFGDGNGRDAHIARRRDGSYFLSIEDENRDGRADLIMYFDRRALLDIFDLGYGHLFFSRAPRTRDVVVRATLADGCTEVEGRRTIGFRR